MLESGNIVRVSNVTKHFQLGKVEVQALKGVDLQIARGEYLSIMGPSGSGKSTLFNMIGGLDKPTSGKVFIDEVDIAQLDAYELAWLRCRKIGYIFQTFNLIPVMTALENVTLPMIFAGMHQRRAAGTRHAAPRAGRPGRAPTATSPSSSPAASSSAWPSPAPSPTTPPSSWPTSPPATST